MYHEGLQDRLLQKMERALQVYAPLLYQPVGALENAQGLTTREHFRAVPEGGFAPIAPGTSWGGEWMNLWVKGSFTVPAALDGQTLYAVSHCGGVEQLFFLNGEPHGIFNAKNRDFIGGNHAAQPLGAVRAGETYAMAFECYAGHFCVGSSPYDHYDYRYPDPPADDFGHVYQGVAICTRDDALFTLLFDLRELLGAATCLPASSFVRGRARRTLEEINRVLPLDPRYTSPAAFRDCVAQALTISRPFFDGGNNRAFGRVGVIGHSHMDTAWLWPVKETIRKCARTYANALQLMERYPGYQFLQSSALHSEWMKTYYPSIFEKIKQRVAEGRYEPNGGVYVECDCNVTSGELMARQFLKGQQFTRENFNYTADVFWLPDTFGYNANIPQIMLGSGVKYFCTTKIDWNELNKFPYESFTWRGIDGSEVLTHFARTHCWPDVDDVGAAVNEISLKDTTDLRLVAYGYGDGGGGPTDGMLETGLRASHMAGMPEIVPMTVSAFMHELEAQQAQLPVYHDELYLELHRGTLTQLHDVKRKNRKAEYALREAEFFRVLAGLPYTPADDQRLKTLLKNQFHDILPGTCITPVYERYNEEMDALLADYAAVTARDAAALSDGGDGVTLFNTLSFPRQDPAVIDAAGYAVGLPSQRYTDLCGRERLAVGGLRLPGFGSCALTLGDAPEAIVSPFTYDGTTLTTPFATLVFDETGAIASLIDRATGRELRKPGGAPLNVFLFGEDVPLQYDNWDLERDVLGKLRPAAVLQSRTLITDGAVELRLRSVYAIGEGTALTQDLVVYADTPRIDFHTLVDWQSPHHLLKVGFDLNVAAPTARCEIQFGAMQRATTENTSLELAKFEVCNRNYTDVSEPGFGAALLNDCKYGVTVTDCNLRLSLMRGGTHPDATGDCGLHEMTYALYIHDGGFRAEAAVHPAYQLNLPLIAVKGDAVRTPIAAIDAPNIIVEAVKPAEDGTDAFVLRLYECEGTQTRAQVRLGIPVSGATETNLLEDLLGALSLTDGAVTLHFRPFEIKTIKFTR